MPLTVLSVGYSLAPVGPDAVGGAEQILSALDHALVAAGHHSIVVANDGSEVAGTLVPTGPVPAQITDAERTVAHGRRGAAIAEALARFPIDLVHSHALDFADHLPAADIPTSVTLHLPPEFYPAGCMPIARPQTWFNCVSASQRCSFPRFSAMLPEIDNGVAVERLQTRLSRRNFALCLGRICPEKGFEHAIDQGGAARRNAARDRRRGVPLRGASPLFRGRDPSTARPVYPFSRLGRLGAQASTAERRAVSAGAGLAAETNSLVAMEAIACGTPVIAFPSGALADIVEPRVTGYLVENAREMAATIRAVDRIDREHCREVARRRFSLDRMAAGYFTLYHRLAAETS
jgi:glycosyltransferase involved in cell wall biosynthesis